MLQTRETTFEEIKKLFCLFSCVSVLIDCVQEFYCLTNREIAILRYCKSLNRVDYEAVHYSMLSIQKGFENKEKTALVSKNF